MKEFPPFRLDDVNQCLLRRRDTGDGERILLTPKAFALLRYLVDHAGRLVTQDEILDAVWPGVHVQPQVVKSHILDLRSALGDHAKHPLFIETLHRRGYRFIAPVSESSSAIPTTPVRPPQRTLVGRTRPLSALRECLEMTFWGQRQIVFVTGEAGIGKTALTDEFHRSVEARATDVRFARGQCIEAYGSKEAYYPMLEALGELCRGPGRDSVVQALAAAPTWLVQFPAVLKREHSETLQREILGATHERMLREIGEVLQTLSSERPLVLIFEDLQWVDHSTVDLISAIARHRTSAKLMLLGTYRPADILLADHPLRAVKQDLLVHQLCTEIALEPLRETEIAEYLAADSSGAEVPSGLSGLIHRHSEGNPLFMVAALAHLIERGLISRTNSNWHVSVPLEKIDFEVPESLREMIEAQIERLKVEEQRALELASISGISFLAGLCAGVADVEPQEFEDQCEELSRRHQIVRVAGSQSLTDGTVSQRYEFVHSLYRDVCYNRQAPGRRAKLHQRVGEQLEALNSQRLSEVAPELASHFEKASDWPRAVKYLRLQAETAGRRYAPREAIAIMQHALQLSSKLPEAERAASETAILEKLASMYVVSFDTRAIDTYEALVAMAAKYGLVDVEIRALIDMAYPLSWTSTKRCLEVIERALQLSEQQQDPLIQARTRASCLVRRVWAGGWDEGDAQACRDALAVIRQAGDPLLLATYLVDCNFMQWASSHYREAQRDAVNSLAILSERPSENPYLVFAYWLSQFILPWSLLLLGQWGEALRQIGAEIAIAEKNGDPYRPLTLRAYEAWVHFHAMDYAGVLAICQSVLPSVGATILSPWRRICLVLAGSAATGLGDYQSASKYLTAAKDEMDREAVIFDWYFRMLLESALTELALAQGDRSEARQHAAQFLKLTQATAERTWQSLAWATNARIAMEDSDPTRAEDLISNALATIDGFEAPLAAWRVHAVASELYERGDNRGLAEHHRELSRATILKLANSLSTEEDLRQTFLRAPLIAPLMENIERSTHAARKGRTERRRKLT